MNALTAHVKYDDSFDKYTSLNNQQITKISDEVSTKQKHSSSQLIVLPILPDSGASLENLIKCNKTVTAVEGSKLSCQGWLPITFKIHGHTTSQPIFICGKVDKIYFSQKGCLATKILPPTFSYPMSTTKDTHDTFLAKTLKNINVPQFKMHNQWNSRYATYNQCATCRHCNSRYLHFDSTQPLTTISTT